MQKIRDQIKKIKKGLSSIVGWELLIIVLIGEIVLWFCKTFLF